MNILVKKIGYVPCVNFQYFTMYKVHYVYTIYIYILHKIFERLLAKILNLPLLACNVTRLSGELTGDGGRDRRQ